MLRGPGLHPTEPMGLSGMRDPTQRLAHLSMSSVTEAQPILSPVLSPTCPQPNPSLIRLSFYLTQDNRLASTTVSKFKKAQYLSSNIALRGFKSSVDPTNCRQTLYFNIWSFKVNYQLLSKAKQKLLVVYMPYSCHLCLRINFFLLD